MKFNPRTGRLLLSAGTILAPVLVLQTVQALVGQKALKPAQASAGASAESPPGFGRGDQAEARAAVAWLAARGPARADRSPMIPALELPAVIERPVEPAVINKPEPVANSEPLIPTSISSLTVTAVMSGDRGAMAVIRGAVFREGDELADLWKVVAIDARAMTVRVQGPNGITLELTRRKP